MTRDPAGEYQKLLGSLEKDAFEDAFCARLAIVFADFQRVIRKPKGDAGLDGLSHGQTRGYCCYGPEQAPFKMNTKGLKPDILRKFRADLRRLFELDYGPGKRLIRKPSPEMSTILASGRKLKNVYLVVSVFESHQLIGPLNESFEEYKTASACLYVDPAAQPIIWGPKDLATNWAVDEHTLFRIEQYALVTKVRDAAATGIAPSDTGGFDDKFDHLLGSDPTLHAAVGRLREHFRKAWGTALALDQELAATSVALHEQLEHARGQAAVTADLRSGQVDTPLSFLEEMRSEVQKHIDVAFGARLGPLLTSIADGEIARLIGECPIEWRQKRNG